VLRNGTDWLAQGETSFTLVYEREAGFTLIDQRRLIAQLAPSPLRGAHHRWAVGRNIQESGVAFRGG
jgi:hypothetical protein